MTRPTINFSSYSTFCFAGDVKQPRNREMIEERKVFGWVVWLLAVWASQLWKLNPIEHLLQEQQQQQQKHFPLSEDGARNSPQMFVSYFNQNILFMAVPSRRKKVSRNLLVSWANEISHCHWWQAWQSRVLGLSTHPPQYSNDASSCMFASSCCCRRSHRLATSLSDSKQKKYEKSLSLSVRLVGGGKPRKGEKQIPKELFNVSIKSGLWEIGFKYFRMFACGKFLSKLNIRISFCSYFLSFSKLRELLTLIEATP